MEPAKIDWENIDSIFILDQAFENINAPQWVDFLSSSPHSPQNDVTWFCRSDCNHPTTAEDFLKSPSSKLLRSVNVSKLIGLADWTRREATNLKRRGVGNQLSSVGNEEELENQNPNFSTPPRNHNQIKQLQNKAGNKSSAEKVVVVDDDDEYSEIMLESDEKPKILKATQSAKDLFGGRDIFGKITEFCSELRKMAVATKAKEKDDHEQEAQKSSSEQVCKPLGGGGGVKETEQKRAVLGPISEKTTSERDKERRPLLEVKLDAGEKSNGKGKLRKNKMRGEESENIPVSLNLNNVKREEKVLPIRTNPPTPQGFSATCDPFKAMPPKGPKSRLMEREVLQEQEQIKTLREELSEKNDNESASLVPVAAKEGGRTLDVFWFLKPCTLSS